MRITRRVLRRRDTIAVLAAAAALAMALGLTAVLPAPSGAAGVNPHAGMDMGVSLNAAGADAAGTGVGILAGQLAKARLATARYAVDLDAAKRDGYRVITPVRPDMGVHFLNPAVTDFDVTRPPILVYERRNDRWQLGALEWVFPETPASTFPGAAYGSFPAACHYDDGTFIPAAAPADCPHTAPGSGAAFFFWHPLLVTLHVWLWYPNPLGLFSPTNPFVHPFTAM